MGCVIIYLQGDKDTNEMGTIMDPPDIPSAIGAGSKGKGFV